MVMDNLDTDTKFYSSNLDDDLALAETLVKQVYKRHGNDIRHILGADMLLRLAQVHATLGLAHAVAEVARRSDADDLPSCW